MTEDQRLARLEASVKEIRDALIGNELSGDRGYLHRQSEMDDRVTKIERMIEKGKSFLYGVTVAAGYGLASVLQSIATMLSNIKH